MPGGNSYRPIEIHPLGYVLCSLLPEVSPQDQQQSY